MGEPIGPDSNITMPPRGLVYARPVIHEGMPALDILCDCACAVLVKLDCERPGEHLDGHEIPYECPNCHSVTWLTLRFAAIQGLQPDSPAGE